MAKSTIQWSLSKVGFAKWLMRHGCPDFDVHIDALIRTNWALYGQPYPMCLTVPIKEE